MPRFAGDVCICQTALCRLASTLKTCASVGGFDESGEAGDCRFCDVAGERDAAALLGFLDFHRGLFFWGQVKRAYIFGQLDDGWRRASGKQCPRPRSTQVRHLLNKGVGLAVLEAHIHKPVVQLLDRVRP